ncbi:hypothetical protein B7463_g1125, partial [Scytalidium lignicola]
MMPQEKWQELRTEEEADQKERSLIALGLTREQLIRNIGCIVEVSQIDGVESISRSFDQVSKNLEGLREDYHRLLPELDAQVLTVQKYDLYIACKFQDPKRSNERVRQLNVESAATMSGQAPPPPHPSIKPARSIDRQSEPTPELQITIRHPAYPEEQDRLITFYTSGSASGGIHHETAREACRGSKSG